MATRLPIVRTSQYRTIPKYRRQKSNLPISASIVAGSCAVKNWIEHSLNLSVKDINGEILVVSQFTLHASTKKGNRPSYIKAAKPEISLPIYNKFLKHLELQFGKNIKKGIFGAQMQVKLVNDGPITLIIDSKERD